jgi:hypothetical protein
MKRILLIDGENLKGKIKTVFENQGENDLIWLIMILRGSSIKFLRD